VVIGQALSHFATTFPVGLLLASVFFGLCRLGGWAYEQSERRKQRESGSVSPSVITALEHLEERHPAEIECMGGRRHLEVPR
jgi:hypothetical protein